MTGTAAKTDRESRILQVEETGIPFADCILSREREGTNRKNAKQEQECGLRAGCAGQKFCVK